MSTQLALGVVGAGIGFFFGSPQLGFVIGSLIGGLLDPPKSEGPRLADKKLQQSTYGAMIPYFWGEGRIAGTMIDQTDLEEHKEKSSGKGGPEVTNYTYSASFAILLGGARVFGQPAIRGITKIWADARLIWSIESGEECPFTIYYGTEDQLPDPTFEAIHGVGEVPAHRGYAYVVATDYYLTDFGNRIPSFEFLVYTDGGNYPFYVATGDPWTALAPGYNQSHFTLADGLLTVSATNGGPSYAWMQFDINDNLSQVGTTVFSSPGAGSGLLGSINSHVIPNLDSPTTYYWALPNPVGIFVQGADESATGGGWQGNYAVTVGGIQFHMNGAGLAAQLSSWTEGGAYRGSYNFPPSHANEYGLGVDLENEKVYAAFNGAGGGGQLELYKFDTDLNLEHHWPNAAFTGTFADSSSTGLGNNFVVYQDQIAYDHHPGGVHRVALLDIDATAGTASDSSNGPLLITPGEFGRFANLGNGLVAVQGGGVFSLNPPPGAAALSTIVGNLTDMTPAVGRYDATELTDPVRWFVVASQMTVRNAIQALRQVFFFDAVESDDQIKYRKRSEVSTFEIPDDDLSGRSYGAESGEPLKTIRTREQELPRTVTITYIDVDRDYQIGSQSTPRQTTLSQQDTTVQVPVGLNTDEAMQKCWTLINGAWVEREHFEWSTTRKWAHLEPCDVGLIRGRVIRIQTRVEAPDGVIRWTGVLAAPSIYANEDSSIYFQPGTGAPADGWIEPTPPLPLVATKMVLLDLPLLSESDYPNGFYAAVGPAAVGRWPGAQVLKSVDGGSTYTAAGESLVADTIGSALSTLGNWTGGNNFDEKNRLDVVIDDPDNELVSVSEQAVLNGANRFSIGSASAGWEVAQFKTATLTGPQQYRLSGLLRGRYGTERLIGTHGANETFVLLPTSINVNSPAGEIGASRKYKGVTLGMPSAGVAPVDFINTGVAVKPYTPVLVEGGRNAAGDITINWARRTRINGVWLESVEVPLNEPTEKYRVMFYTTGFAAEKSYFDVTAATTVTYLAVSQGVDFGSLQNPLYVGVRQFGQYGLGYETRTTI